MKEEIEKQIEYLRNHLENVDHSVDVKVELGEKIERLQQLLEDFTYKF